MRSAIGLALVLFAHTALADLEFTVTCESESQNFEVAEASVYENITDVMVLETDLPGTQSVYHNDTWSSSAIELGNSFVSFIEKDHFRFVSLNPSLEFLETGIDFVLPAGVEHLGQYILREVLSRPGTSTVLKIERMRTDFLSQTVETTGGQCTFEVPALPLESGE